MTEIEQMNVLALIVFGVIVFVALQRNVSWTFFFGGGVGLFLASLAFDVWMTNSVSVRRFASSDGFGFAIGLLLMIVAITLREKKTV